MHELMSFFLRHWLPWAFSSFFQPLLTIHPLFWHIKPSTIFFIFSITRTSPETEYLLAPWFWMSRPMIHLVTGSARQQQKLESDLEFKIQKSQLTHLLPFITKLLEDCQPLSWRESFSFVSKGRDAIVEHVLPFFTWATGFSAATQVRQQPEAECLAVSLSHDCHVIDTATSPSGSTLYRNQKNWCFSESNKTFSMKILQSIKILYIKH